MKTENNSSNYVNTETQYVLARTTAGPNWIEIETFTSLKEAATELRKNQESCANPDELRIITFTGDSRKLTLLEKLLYNGYKVLNDIANKEGWTHVTVEGAGQKFLLDWPTSGPCTYEEGRGPEGSLVVSGGRKY